MEILTIADAVTTLEFLYRRNLLCTHCGNAIATWENPWHQRCDGCKPNNGPSYSKARTPSVLEANIIQAFLRWVARNSADAPGDAGGVVAVGEGSGSTPKLHSKHLG